MMKSLRPWVVLCILLSSVALAHNEASAITIDVSTNNSGWVANYSSFSGDAYHYACGAYDCLSISSNGNETGSFVGGGTAGAFGGTWSVALSFVLPLNAQNVTLFYTSIGVDDRATLSLNGTDLGIFFIFGPQISESTTMPFLLGGSNTLRLNVINNPFDPYNGSPTGFPDAFDGTAVVLNASVSYNVSSVPEPSSMLLLLSGMGLMGMLASRRRRLPKV